MYQNQEHLPIPYDQDKYQNFETFIEANEPMWFTRKDAIPTACGECEWPMIDGTL